MSSGLKSKRNRVVVRFKDGRLLKGYTHDFTPVKETFHLSSSQEKDTSEIRTADLKAIFFVRTLEGNRDYDEKKRFDEADNPQLPGLKIKAKFSDGEVIRGTTQGYSKKRKGFFIFPVDPQSNNERVYVLADALHDAKVGSGAEEEEATKIVCPTCKVSYTVPRNKMPQGKRAVATCKKCGGKIVIEAKEGKNQPELFRLKPL